MNDLKTRRRRIWEFAHYITIRFGSSVSEMATERGVTSIGSAAVVHRRQFVIPDYVIGMEELEPWEWILTRNSPSPDYY